MEGGHSKQQIPNNEAPKDPTEAPKSSVLYFKQAQALPSSIVGHSRLDVCKRNTLDIRLDSIN